MTLITPIPTEVVSPIRPSEALRLGRLTYAPGDSGILVEHDKTACALGAMLAGWGIDPWTEDADFGKAAGRLAPFGLQPSNIFSTYDEAQWHGDGDAAVLAYLEERGL